jgi:hypothetical protein
MSCPAGTTRRRIYFADAVAEEVNPVPGRTTVGPGFALSRP